MTEKNEKREREREITYNGNRMILQSFYKASKFQM